MGYTCKTCGVTHEEQPTCFGAPLPHAAAVLPPEEFSRRVQASSDQCILDEEHFFILGNLDLPVRGAPTPIVWMVWTTLSPANFERASKLRHTAGTRRAEPPYFGWLSNQIPGYPSTLNLKLVVHTQPVGVRPRLEVVDEGHPLARDQAQGIDQERAGGLIHAAMHGDDEN